MTQNHPLIATGESAPTMPRTHGSPHSPFCLDNDDAYRRWRDWKLANRPDTARDPVVELRDPARLRPAEHAELVRRLTATNMVIYHCRDATLSRSDLHRFAARLGLHRPDAHLCADTDHIAAVRVRPANRDGHYIPYTNRPLSWHTDGYYNATHARVLSFVLHCVQPAAHGGDSMLLDPDIVYLLLRDRDPDYIRSLSRADAMSIPPNVAVGRELRPRSNGPVFSIDEATGSLHMRYSARKRHIQWHHSNGVRAAQAALEDILMQAGDWTVHHHLEAGQGILCNNVLHRRNGFEDGTGATRKRVLYRARYYERIAGTGLDIIGLCGLAEAPGCPDRAPRR